ncbi:MAG: flagellar biosynthesis anti-sigma factor FlgM [Chloroflexi bacterium]|nr:flagellar biosynthesis anti-sigma factor FlgM [Chloroflexota bacterium]
MADIGRTPRPAGTGAVIYDISQARARAAAAPAEASAPADSAGFTESAQELARAHEAVKASPGVRAERVKALKQQIESGKYNPDPREVARKILERGL